MHIQIKAKNGAFYKAQPLIRTLNEMLFPNKDRGGNQRGGYRGGRDGGGGRGGNESVTDRMFISEKTRKVIKPLIQGLMVSMPSEYLFVESPCTLILLLKNSD